MTRESGAAVLDSTVNPFPAIPWRSTVVAATGEHIHRVRINLLRESSADRITHTLERHLDDPALPSLVGTREHRAWLRFAKLPFVQRIGNQIILGDGRFSYGGPNGWASFALPLPTATP